ncbi:MAG: hypothetical protein L7F78_14405 [Syntrophales bacterium LBB04]|nr:hypothetical protein [Syntrophales bacterium LBB04]
MTDGIGDTNGLNEGLNIVNTQDIDSLGYSHHPGASISCWGVGSSKRIT